VGTIVGFVVAGYASDGNPKIMITGAYVGCKTGKAFAEAYKKDKNAVVLLGPYQYSFAESKAGQTLILYAGKVSAQALQAVRSGKSGVDVLDISKGGFATQEDVLKKAGVDPTIASIVTYGPARNAIDKGKKEFEKKTGVCLP